MWEPIDWWAWMVTGRFCLCVVQCAMWRRWVWTSTKCICCLCAATTSIHPWCKGTEPVRPHYAMLHITSLQKKVDVNGSWYLRSEGCNVIRNYEPQVSRQAILINQHELLRMFHLVVVVVVVFVSCLVPMVSVLCSSWRSDGSRKNELW